MHLPRQATSVCRGAESVRSALEGGVLPSGKNTYCCKMGSENNPEQEQQQFRAYSWQAPLFCVRMANNKGYSTGRLSRGGC